MVVKMLIKSETYVWVCALHQRSTVIRREIFYGRGLCVYSCVRKSRTIVQAVADLHLYAYNRQTYIHTYLALERAYGGENRATFILII